MASDPETVLITGATSGIGRALAIAYAQPGRVLAVTGRDAERLRQTADRCRARGASVHAETCDVTDAAGLADWIARVDRTAPLGLVIANAGISAGTAGGAESAAQIRRIFAVNLDGVVNTVTPVLAAMAGRGAGQIAIMSSLAGFVAHPGAPAYCASKAAVRVWGEALGGVARAHGVAVTVICPGFVRSAITEANDFPMPMLMDADAAARLIVRRLRRRPARISFPWPLHAIARTLAALPRALREPLFRALPRKR